MSSDHVGDAIDGVKDSLLAIAVALAEGAKDASHDVVDAIVADHNPTGDLSREMLLMTVQPILLANAKEQIESLKTIVEAFNEVMNSVHTLHLAATLPDGVPTDWLAPAPPDDTVADGDTTADDTTTQVTDESGADEDGAAGEGDGDR